MVACVAPFNSVTVFDTRTGPLRKRHGTCHVSQVRAKAHIRCVYRSDLGSLEYTSTSPLQVGGQLLPMQSLFRESGAPGEYVSPTGLLTLQQFMSSPAFQNRSTARFTYHATVGNGGLDGGKGRGGGGGGGGGDGGDFGGPKDGEGPWRLLTLIFAFLVGVGGLMGYKRKGSRASLIASSTIGTALVGAAILMSGATAPQGLAIALVSTLALGGYMLRGYVKTRKPFPQGVFALLSTLLSIGYVSALR
eukprot:jgi/Botrbrau1/4113/Bobra.152_3s0060.1